MEQSLEEKVSTTNKKKDSTSDSNIAWKSLEATYQVEGLIGKGAFG